MKHTIDAKDQKLGRVATKAASLLMGKNLTSFVRNAAPEDVVVEVINTSKAMFDSKKMKQTTYARYSGHPGGLKTPNMVDIVAKKGYSELFRLAIQGMLPNNRLRPGMLKRLVISE
jgi:large subunit ribosomal protein L13